MLEYIKLPYCKHLSLDSQIDNFNPNFRSKLTKSEVSAIEQYPSQALKLLSEWPQYDQEITSSGCNLG